MKITILWPDGSTSTWLPGRDLDGDGPLTPRQLGDTVGLLAAAGVVVPLGTDSPPTRFRATVPKENAMAGLRAVQALIDRLALG